MSGIIDIVEYQKILTIMKNKLHIFLILAVIALLFGCQKDPDSLFGGDHDGKLRLTLSIGEQDEIATYSAATVNECLIDDVVVLLFDGTTDKYIAGESIDSTSDQLAGNNGDKLRTVTAYLWPKPGDKIVVLVNSGKTLIPLTPGVSTRGDINGAFPLKSLSSLNALNLDLSENGKQMPMSGEVVYTGGGQVTCPVRRSVAKVELILADDLEDATASFTPNHVIWYMGNVADPESIGAIYTPMSAADCIVQPGNDFLTDNILTGVKNNSLGLSDAYYLPEYPNATKASGKDVESGTWSADRTCVLVSSDAGYYRIDLYDHATGKFIDIRRNTHIKVTIRKVKSAGYVNDTQAQNNPGSNLEYEIESTGADENIIVSNGQYAVALDYDEVYLYAPGGEYEIAKARYMLPDDMSALGAGTANQISVSVSGIGADYMKVNFSPKVLTSVTQPIKLSITDKNFEWYTMVGRRRLDISVNIRLGNITRTIKVYYGAELDAHYGSFKLNGDKVESVKWLRNDNNFSITDLGDAGFSLQTNENITPVRWVAYNPETGAEVTSTENNPGARPLFERKYAEGEVIRLGSNPGRTKFYFVQETPVYLGWVGGDPNQTGSTYFSNRVVGESIVEVRYLAWYKPQPGVLANVTDRERGLNNTLHLMDDSYTGLVRTDFEAAYACYMKNDRNGNGVIDADEPVVWYLPAVNQLVGVHIGYAGIADSRDYSSWTEANTEYMSSTEWNSSWAEVIRMQAGHVMGMYKYGNQAVTRCVRDI